MFDTLLSAFNVCRFDVNPASFDNGVHRESIAVYSRAKACADGVLVDVSRLAFALGFKDAVALTHCAYDECIANACEEALDEAEREVRVLDVLLPALRALRAQSHRRLREIVFMSRSNVELKIVAGPGDRGETVLTILSVDED